MAAQKCKKKKKREKKMLQVALKDFWSSANPKLKNIKSVKTLTSLGSYWRKCKNGDPWELLLFPSDL